MALPFAAWLVLPVSLTHPPIADVHLGKNLGFGGVYGNPVALRLKELETLERVAERIDKISVFGGLDQVLNGLVKLR